MELTDDLAGGFPGYQEGCRPLGRFFDTLGCGA
jgi:hypothetical protein